MGTKFNPSEIKALGVTEVYCHPEATVDIVLVHGLGGDPQKTWAAKNGTFWPVDFLPATFKQAPVRILVYGYNADMSAFDASDRSASSNLIHQNAQALVTAVAMERRRDDNDENPIIWIAHSLGGTLLKRALELSSDLTAKNVSVGRSIFVSTFGIMFLGTPHTVADLAKWGVILQRMLDSTMPKKMFDAQPDLVKTFKANSETFQNINLRFLNIYQYFQIAMFHESLETDLNGSKFFIVDQMAGSPPLPGVIPYGIGATHSDICKFGSQTSSDFRKICTTIEPWVAGSQAVIRSRWVTERKLRQSQKDNTASDQTGTHLEPKEENRADDSMPNTPALSHSGIISTSMIHSVASIEPENSQEPIFIKPPGFRPNSFFVGRDSQLAEMHRMLFDKKRRAVGVAAVLIQSLPGGGKTHVARQYVYSHLNDFPGGVFWVRAQSLPQLAAGFWDIARGVAIKSSSGTPSDSQDLQHFVSIVHEWFSTHHEWLLVLDGIQFDHAEELAKYIPDSTNSSLIYTSTEGNVGGDHHFMNPQVIKLPLLSAREAQELLLLELDKKEPSVEDRKHSMELVSLMGFLPIVIHAVAQRLKATGEPLAKFARSYATGPQLRDLDTYVGVVKQLEAAQAFEALNLIKILSFYSQHIPVEMIALGLGALTDVQMKAKESSGRSLNNTFKILNRFALVNRNNFEESSASSQSSKVSKEMLADNVDVIKLHSVVQDFFLDSLKGDGEFPLWLGRAVALFDKSYRKANQRIKRKTNAGLVADYRSYEVHGTRLLFHVSWYEKKKTAIPDVRTMLEDCLRHIVMEIRRRTRESSSDLVQGRPTAFQTSIFDRTSSSSDTGPPTPGAEDNVVRSSTFGSEGKAPLESPLSTHQEHVSTPKSPRRIDFTPISDRDAGYDSDWDDGHSEKSHRTDLHRTIRALEHNRYKDSFGAWRAVIPNVSDARVSPEVAQGVFEMHRDTRQSSRGRVSAQSQAEAALGEISRGSPPPIRSAGRIHDRGDSRSRTRRQSLLDDRGRNILGYSSYAPALTGETTHVVSTTSLESSTNMSSPRPRPSTPAMASLQTLSQHAVSPVNRLFQEPERLPYIAPYPMSDFSPIRLPDDRSFEWRHEPSTYPAQRGHLPIQSISESLLEPLMIPKQNKNFLNLELLSHSRVLDGRDAENIGENGRQYRRDGYTSQPISRDPSGQQSRGRRSPSLIESEPAPELPRFSPKLDPTSYEVYENRRDREMESRPRLGPNLGHTRAAQIGSLEPWKMPSENVSAQRNNLNAAAPVFIPSSARVPVTNNRTSPPLAIGSAPPSASGGFRIGRRMIEFGDFPEPVDLDLARERVESRERQKSAARAAFEEGQFRRRREKDRSNTERSVSDLTDKNGREDKR